MVEVKFNLPPESRPLIARAKAILLKPKDEWAVIDAEPATLKGLYLGYAMILAAIPALADLIGSLVFGRSYGFLGFGVTWRPAVGSAIASAVTNYLLSLVVAAVVALVIEFLAPTFGGEKNRIQAFKVAIYASTAGWVAGVLYLVPALGALAILGGFYGVYLLWLGLPRLMKVPEEKALIYLVVAILIALVANSVVRTVGSSVMSAGRAGALYGENGPMTGTMNVPGYGSVDLGRAQAAQKAADAAIASALAAHGEAPRAGVPAAVQPVAASELAALLPGTMAGFLRGEVSSASTGAAGMSSAMARATYTRGDGTIELTVTDMGGAAAFAQLGSAFNVSHSEQKGDRYEKVANVGGRLTSEKYDASDRAGEYSVVVGERFMVEASGRNVDMSALKAAVTSVGFGRLEAMARSQP